MTDTPPGINPQTGRPFKPEQHRVYLRWPEQQVSDKTTTESPEVAAYAYGLLKARADLVGQEVAVAWTCDGDQQAYHDFAAPLASIQQARAQLAQRPRPKSGGNGE